MRPADLIKRLQDSAFRPFRVHLSDGSVYDVPEPGMVIVGKSAAVLPVSWDRDEEGHRVARDWRTISLLHIVQFSDVEPADEAERKAG